MRYCLEQKKLSTAEQDAWIREAVNSLCLCDDETIANAYKGNYEWQHELPQSLCRDAKCFYPSDFQDITSRKQKLRFQSRYPLPAFAIAIVTLIFCVLLLRYPSTFFSEEKGAVLYETFLAGSDVVIVWVIALIVTWMYAVISSSIIGCLSYISPSHFMKSKLITHGEIISFKQNIFFTFFQFIWIPFAAITLILFEKKSLLTGSIVDAWNNDATVTATNYLNSLNATQGIQSISGENVNATLRALLLNDTAVIALAAFLACITVIHQELIQRHRTNTRTTFFWFDRRVSKMQWFVRVFMVGVDMFIGVILIMKILALATICAELAGGDILRVNYFSPDGGGGIKFLNDIFMNLLWIIILLGFFVMASLYAHRNMDGYRTSDLIFVSIYCILVVLSMVPFFTMEYKLAHAQTELIFSICNNASFSYICNARPWIETSSEFDDIAKYVRDVSAIKEWKVSVINSGTWGLLLSMISQAVIIIIQYALKFKGGAVPAGIASRLPLGRANNLTSRLP